MININTEEYWDRRFESDWEIMQGKEQTVFFANVALSLMPEWLREEIKTYKLSICDFGCAGGQAVDVLHQFFHTKVMGADFSEQAVALAQKTYPDYTFFKNDIVDGQMEDFHVDISYLSNVLEHLDRPWEAAERAAGYASRYLIILVPFRETLKIEEHCSHFDLDSIPLNVADLELVFADYMDCSKISDTLYSSPQIFLLYRRKRPNSEMVCMADVAGAFEREALKKYAQEKSKSCGLLEQKIRMEEELKELAVCKAELEKRNQEFAELSGRNAELEKQVQELMALAGQNAELEKQVQELMALAGQNAEAVRQSQKLEELARKGKSEIEDVIRSVCMIQSRKTYRLGLLVQRFVIQCLLTHEKKDFIRWFLRRMRRKDTSAKALREFDNLENVKSQLNRAVRMVDADGIGLAKGIHRKKTQQIILFAAVPFYDVGGGQRSAQIARAFHSLGYQVFYIYGFPCTEDHIPDMFIPANEHRMLDEIDEEWFNDIADSRTLVIFEIPYKKFETYLDLSKQAGCFTVYEHIDNWDTSLGCLFYEAEVFQRFLQKADLITVTAKKLGEKIKEYCSRPYLYLPNAVNIEVFEPLKHYDRPADLKKGRKTLLYFGSLWGEWFEWDRIDYIAEKCPECEINLIGDYSGCMERVRKKKKNVHFLGLKKQTELPAYLKYTDYALLPFKNSEIGAYVSPLKIFEYIAMNVRVLATGLDDIRGYPNVFRSDSKAAWVKILKEDPSELTDSSVFLSQNNWYARCGEMMERSGIFQIKATDLSVIVLNYNNRNVICRCVDTLLAHNRRYGYEVVIVDNGSTDDSCELLNQYADRILLVRNTKNGCSSGRNLGVASSHGKYLCFLDSDQWAISDYWLDSALDLLQEDSKIGAVGWAAGWFTPDSPAGPIVDYMYNRAVDRADVWYRTDIAYLGTGGLVMERSLFRQVGGFDEFYDPTCFEYTDLSLKIREAGYELAYCPYIGVMHLPHQTTKSGSRRHAKLMMRNGEYFKRKWKERKPELLEYYYG